MSTKNVPGVYNLARFFGSNYAVTEDLVCYRVFIPDGNEHRQLLATLLNLPTKEPVWYTETTEHRDDLAAMYQLAYERTLQEWLEGGIGCMDCAKIIECIENDEDVRNALAAWFVSASKNDTSVKNALNAFNNFPTTTPRGEPLSSTKMNEDIGSPYNPTCDKDVLWSQCLGLVEETNAAIVDVLERFEVISNGAELLNSIISSIPLVSAAEVASGIDGIFELFNYYQEAFLEQYLAQYTTTFNGTRDQIACALFCECRDDCVITIDRILTVLQARIEAYLSIPVINTLADLLTFAAGIDQDDTFVVDLAFWFGWKALAVANYFFGGIAGDVLPIVTELYADNPSSDWELLCTECGWEYTIDFTDTLGDWSVGAGTWVDGVGVVNDTGSAFPYTSQVTINVADWAGATLTNWRVTANSTSADSGAFRGAIFVVSGVPSFQDIGGGETGTYDLADTASESEPDLIAIQISNASVPGTNTILSVTLSGIGDMPVWS